MIHDRLQSSHDADYEARNPPFPTVPPHCFSDIRSPRTAGTTPGSRFYIAPNSELNAAILASNGEVRSSNLADGSPMCHPGKGAGDFPEVANLQPFREI